MIFAQVHLAKGNQHQMCWIPVRYATVGRALKLKEKDGWDNGWTVVETFSKMSEEELSERSQDYKRTRKASDI